MLDADFDSDDSGSDFQITLSSRTKLDPTDFPTLYVSTIIFHSNFG